MSQWPAMGLISVVAAGGTLLCWLYVAEVAKNLETSRAAAGVGSGQVPSLLLNDRGEVGKPATDLSPAIAALTQSVRELAAGLEQVKQGLQEERGRSGKETDQLAADLAQVQQSAQRESEQARRLTEVDWLNGDLKLDPARHRPPRRHDAHLPPRLAPR